MRTASADRVRKMAAPRRHLALVCFLAPGVALSALRAYREHRAAGRRGVPPDAPLDFAPASPQPLIRHDGVTDRRRWESALFLKVRDEIQTGNLAIDGAKKGYRHHSCCDAR